MIWFSIGLIVVGAVGLVMGGYFLGRTAGRQEAFKETNNFLKETIAKTEAQLPSHLSLIPKVDIEPDISKIKGKNTIAYDVDVPSSRE